MTSNISPAARALVALELIQNNPGITAQRLADRAGTVIGTLRSRKNGFEPVAVRPIPVEPEGSDGDFASVQHRPPATSQGRIFQVRTVEDLRGSSAAAVLDGRYPSWSRRRVR
jgi:hypothetical protein